MKSARKPHILFISYYFPPMGGGGVQRVLKFLKYWDTDRYHLSLLTVKSSHFYAKDASLNNEIPAEVNVYRTGTLDPFRVAHLIRKLFFFTHRKGDGKKRESGYLLRRLANLIFLPDSRVLWLPFAVYRVSKINRDHQIDLVIASMPPFTSGLIARMAGKRASVPYILDYRDSWMSNPYLPQSGKIRSAFQRSLEKFTLEQASGVVFVNPSLKDTYLAEYKILQNKPLEIVRNGYDPEDFPGKHKSSDAEKNKLFRLGIIGSVYSQGNAPETLLQAVTLLKKEGNDQIRNLRLVFLGKWTGEFLSGLQQSECNELVELHEYRPHREALSFAESLDVLALAIHTDRPGSEAVVPGRIYEYLYLKKPVLAMCPPEGDLAGLVRECKAGEICDYSDVRGIANVLLDWLDGRESLQERYTFQHLQPFDRRNLTRKMKEFTEKILC